MTHASANGFLDARGKRLRHSRLCNAGIFCDQELIRDKSLSRVGIVDCCDEYPLESLAIRCFVDIGLRAGLDLLARNNLQRSVSIARVNKGRWQKIRLLTQELRQRHLLDDLSHV